MSAFRVFSFSAFALIQLFSFCSGCITLPERTVLVTTAEEKTAAEKQAATETRSYLENDPIFQRMIRGINHPKERCQKPKAEKLKARKAGQC